MESKDEIIEEKTEDPINNFEGDGKFHKLRLKNTHLTPKKKKRK